MLLRLRLGTALQESIGGDTQGLTWGAKLRGRYGKPEAGTRGPYVQHAGGWDAWPVRTVRRLRDIYTCRHRG